jgi:hypothetical protein
VATKVGVITKVELVTTWYHPAGGDVEVESLAAMPGTMAAKAGEEVGVARKMAEVAMMGVRHFNKDLDIKVEGLATRPEITADAGKVMMEVGIAVMTDVGCIVDTTTAVKK